MALFRTSYRIAADVLLDALAAAEAERLSLPSLATFLLRGFVNGTITVERTDYEVGVPRTNKDLALDRDLLREADEKRCAEEVAQSMAHLLEILFRASVRHEVTLEASGRAGGKSGHLKPRS
ncbi:hypothetical protein ABR737_00640 [Streptomyces sp. Edi2]|uniref:hypothetical protein n=1 Tax=Streptomyces sp. Edi2 TaxID=3162528 RepID=UPI0033064478